MILPTLLLKLIQFFSNLSSYRVVTLISMAQIEGLRRSRVGRCGVDGTSCLILSGFLTRRFTTLLRFGQVEI